MVLKFIIKNIKYFRAYQACKSNHMSLFYQSESTGSFWLHPLYFSQIICHTCHTRSYHTIKSPFRVLIDTNSSVNNQWWGEGGVRVGAANPISFSTLLNQDNVSPTGPEDSQITCLGCLSILQS